MTKTKLYGWTLKMLSVIGLFFALRLNLDPTVYLILGVCFYIGWKMQHLTEEQKQTEKEFQKILKNKTPQ